MLLELGLAVGGGLLNAAAGSAEDAELEKQRQKMLGLLQENIIDPAELDRLLADVNRMFNNRLVNTLNSTALRSRGFANSNVVKGATAGAIEGARIGTLSDTRFRALENNRNVRGQMVGVDLQTMPKHTFLGDFASGTLTALPTVLEGSKYFSTPDATLPSDSIELPNITKGTSPSIPSYDGSNIDTGLNTFGQLFNNDLPTFDMPKLNFQDYWSKK